MLILTYILFLQHKRSARKSESFISIDMNEQPHLFQFSLSPSRSPFFITLSFPLLHPPFSVLPYSLLLTSLPPLFFSRFLLSPSAPSLPSLSLPPFLLLSIPYPNPPTSSLSSLPLTPPSLPLTLLPSYPSSLPTLPLLPPTLLPSPPLPPAIPRA